MESEVKTLKKEMRLIMTAVFINIKTILLFGVFGFIISLVIVLIPIKNMYNASSSIFSVAFNEDYEDTKAARQMTALADFFESSYIQDKIIEVLDGSVSRSELANMTKIKSTTSKAILNITTRHKDPAIAIKAANAIAHVIIIETNKLLEGPSGLKLLDRASSVDYAYRGSNIYMIVCVLLTIISAFGCCMYFIYITLASDKVLFIEDCTMDGTLEIMGVIPFSAKKPENKNEAE